MASLERNRSKSAFRNLHKSSLNHLDFLAKKPVKVTESSCPFNSTISKPLWVLLSALFVFYPHLERLILIGKSLSRLCKSKTFFHMEDGFSQFSGKRICLKTSQTRSSNNLDPTTGKKPCYQCQHLIHTSGCLKDSWRRCEQQVWERQECTGRALSEEAEGGSTSQWQYSLWSWHNWQAPR